MCFSVAGPVWFHCLVSHWYFPTSRKVGVVVFEAMLAEFDAVTLTGLGRRGLCDVAQEAARVRSALDALDGRVATAIKALNDNGLGPAATLRSATRCSQREADRRANRAQTLEALPAVAGALAQGAIAAEHVDALGRAVEATSAAAVAASSLLSVAKVRPADVMAKDVRNFTRQHQGDTDLAERHKRRRGARTCRIFDGDNAMIIVHAEFDPVSGAEIRSAVESAADRLFHADGGRDAARDVRTREQRIADALHELLSDSADRNGGPPAVRNQMVVVEQADGTAEIAGSGPLPSSELERLRCVSDLYGMLFNEAGMPLWHGRQVRLATDAQWRALIVRDAGCVICDAKPSRCEAHHVVFWVGPTFGATDITNLALVCKHHHHQIHDHGLQLVHTTEGWNLRAPP